MIKKRSRFDRVWTRKRGFALAAALLSIGAVVLLMGRRRGFMAFKFRPAVRYATGEGPRALAVGDLNGDGWPDIVVANALSNTVTVFFNTGYGTFYDTGSYETGKGPRSLAVGDVDGKDGIDIVVPSGNDDTLDVLLNRGSGSFRARAVVRLGATPPQDQSYEDGVVLADLNHDGRPDAVVSRYSDGVLRVLLNDGHGLGPVASYPMSSSNSISSIVAEDFDMDGNIDVAVADFTVGVRVAYNRGDGTFLPASSISVFSTGTRGIFSEDLNGDGLPDIAAANYASPYLYSTVILNQGHRKYSRGQELRNDSSPDQGAYAVAVGALRPGEPRAIVTTNSNKNSVSVFANRGDGTFSDPVTFPTGAVPVAVVLADLNRDGLTDIVTVNTDDSTLSVLWGSL